MTNNYWRPWENLNANGENDDVSENSRNPVAVSEEMQKAVLNCYQYFCNNGKKYAGHILDLYCVRISNAAPFCEN